MLMNRRRIMGEKRVYLGWRRASGGSYGLLGQPAFSVVARHLRVHDAEGGADDVCAHRAFQLQSQRPRLP